MKGLSSETLFHFVSEKNYLIDIINYDFKPSYVIENFPFETEDLSEIGIPMKCFCDIRLSEVVEHTDWYGEYGIGMKNKWAIKNGLTPVQYYNKNSYPIKEIGKGLVNMRKSFVVHNNSEATYTEVPEWYFSIYSNIWYMKEYRGKQFHKKSSKERNKKFYDEREWRYIPPYNELKKLPSKLPISLNRELLSRIKQDNELKTEFNNSLGSFTSLKYSPEDIAYIIISNEDERLEIINEIKESIKRYSESDIAILSSKIISLEQIVSDF